MERAATQLANYDSWTRLGNVGLFGVTNFCGKRDVALICLMCCVPLPRVLDLQVEVVHVRHVE